MLNSSNNDFLKQVTYVLISLISIFFILHIGSNIIIPFIIAFFTSLLIIGMSNLFVKIKVPKILTMPLAIIVLLLIFLIIGNILNNNIQGVIDKIPYYQDAITNKFNLIINSLHLKSDITLPGLLDNINLQAIAKNSIDSIMVVFKSIGIIIFYILFILLEYKTIGGKIEKIITNNKKRKYVFNIINNIKSNLSSYFIIKTIISFITAFLSYIVMTLFGLDFAIFWAFVIFSLNFIPSVGSIIAISFPIMLSLIQFDTFLPFFILSSLLIGIQVLMGNIIEPKFLGTKLNLSPLAIIIALSFWGSLWGVVGMILSVPLTIIINITLAQIPATKKFSILISEKGNIFIHDKEKE